MFNQLFILEKSQTQVVSKYYFWCEQSLCPSDKAEFGSEKIKRKRKQQHVANDSFTVKWKTQKTKDSILLKEPNEQTNYKFEQKKTNSRPVLEKNESSVTSLSKFLILKNQLILLKIQAWKQKKWHKDLLAIRIMLNHKQ